MVVEKKDSDHISREANVAPKNLDKSKTFSSANNSTLPPETSKTGNTVHETNGILPNETNASLLDKLMNFNANEFSNTSINSYSNSNLDTEDLNGDDKLLKSSSVSTEDSGHCQTDLSCEMEDTNEQEMSIESNDSEIKIQLSDNEVEIGDIDSGLDLEQNKMDLFNENKFATALNNDNMIIQRGDVDECSEEEVLVVPEKQVISIKLADVKSNFSEFDTFMRFFLYFNQEHDDDVRIDFNKKSMDIYFESHDETFNSLHNASNFENAVYKLTLYFGYEVIPDKCYLKKRNKKSLEIHLEKANKVTWGSIGMSLSSTSDLTAIEKYSPNKWTPCTIKTEAYSSTFSNNLQLVKYEHPTGNDIFSTSEKGRFYGYTGLDNLGNTCFMNSVLQCLSNTTPLRDYFLSKKYVKDINKSNPLGHGGVIVEAFAQFLKQLWMGKQSSIAPTRLKALMGEKITSMFMGFNQHDAQEFMSFFLDAIHEDLNRNENRPKIDYKSSNSDKDNEKELFDESDCTTEEKRKQMSNLLKEKANEMWKQYRLFNNSIIIDLFYGQFKSILTCPDCSHKSIMFDPFLYVPLPVPPPKFKYEVIFYSRDEATGFCTGATHFTLKLPKSSTAGELMNVISQNTNVSAKSMRLIQPQEEHRPPKFLNSNWLLYDILEIESRSYSRSSFSDSYSSYRNRPLLLFEIFKDENEECKELCIIQRSRERRKGFGDSRIGLPFFISLPKSLLTYSHLCAVLCSYASHSVSAYRPVASTECSSGAISSKSVRDFNLDLFSSEKRNILFDINNITTPRLVYHKCSNLRDNDILAPFTIRTMNFNGPSVNTPETKIIPPIINEMEEENCPSEDSDISEESQSTLVNEKIGEDSVEEFGKADEQLEEIKRFAEHDNSALLDLGDIFYLAMEWIDSRDSPVAVNCSHRIECRKQIDLCTSDDVSLDECLRLFNEPEVLGPQNCWRCPSCKDLREATKQLSFWRLPPILVIQLKRFKMRNIIFRDKITQLVEYPIHGLDMSKYQYSENDIICNNSNGEQVKPVYDLYAVCNHMGDAFMGHYTAFARSFDEELGWRLFDDSSVENIDESRLVTSNAYLLFYKIRSNETEKKTLN